VTAWVVAKSYTGEYLWTFMTKLTWCYSGLRVTSAEDLQVLGDVVKVPFPLSLVTSWEWNVQDKTNPQPGGWTASAHAQGHFQQNVVTAYGLLTKRHYYPWIDTKVRANGTWSTQAGLG
jgi:hypothetical protein